MNEQMTYQHLESIVGMMPGNVYWKNRQGVYLGCNDNAARLVKLSTRHEIIGKKLSDFVPVEIAHQIEKIDDEIMARGEMTTVEENAFDLDGNPAIYLTRKVPLKDSDGSVIGLVGISVDITELKQTEQQLREAKDKAELANRAKSEFLRNISHDLRTPFTGLLGLSNMLYEQETDPIKKEHLGYLVESAQTLLSIIEGVLSLSMVEAENQAIKTTTFNLHELMKKIINLLKLEAEKKQLDLKISIDHQLPVTMVGDAVRLNRILLNLLSNAVKFTEQGSVELSVHMVSQTKNKIKVLFSIKDTGIGIPANKYRDIFKSFNRLTPAYEGVYPGMGIGLYIVKKFVQQLKGKIWVDSKLGEGSAFYCELVFAK